MYRRVLFAVLAVAMTATAVRAQEIPPNPDPAGSQMEAGLQVMSSPHILFGALARWSRYQGPFELPAVEAGLLWVGRRESPTGLWATAAASAGVRVVRPVYVGLGLGAVFAPGIRNALWGPRVSLGAVSHALRTRIEVALVAGATNAITAQWTTGVFRR